MLKAVLSSETSVKILGIISQKILSFIALTEFLEDVYRELGGSGKVVMEGLRIIEKTILQLSGCKIMELLID
jgi:hypothetical protein